MSRFSNDELIYDLPPSRLSGYGALSGKRFLERWSFTGLAILMILTAMAGFAPALVDQPGRPGPVSALAAAHGIVFFVWLLLFLVQSLLIEAGLADSTSKAAGHVMQMRVCL